jgi:Asp-tRNA(Asn)/Glu-tRNA(Gln) amidotransferase A subunit family amidase
MSLASHSIEELAGAYAKRTLSPVDVVRESLMRLGKLNPVLNAYYLVDEESALAAARASEARWRQGTQLSLLDGTPTSAKDALPAIGWPSYRGSLAHRDPEPATVDAPVIARLREAGAVFLGKTTMPDFGIIASGYSSKHGVTRNPRAPRNNPGGSSSGAAAAVAAGIDTAVIGTDIVGSIRLPASFCGLFGFKPSQGRVPYYPPNDPSLAAGPITRSIADAAIVLNSITKPDARDYTALEPIACDYRAAIDEALPPRRIGVLDGFGFGLNASEEGIRLARDAAKLLEKEGHQVAETVLNFASVDLGQAEFYYKARCFAEFITMPEQRRLAASVIRQWTLPAEQGSAKQLFDAMNAMRQMREKVMALFQSIDFLILPTVHVPPFAAELASPNPDMFEPWANTFLFNITGQPCSSVPCGTTADGLPLGVQIVGRRFDDVGVLRLSRALEKMIRPFEYPHQIDAI